MGDILLPRASPSSLFLSTGQKGMQRLKTVILLFKTFRWAWPSCLGGPPDGDRLLVVGIDMLWWFFYTVPLTLSVLAFGALMGFPHRPRSSGLQIFIAILMFQVYFILSMLVLYSVVYWHRNMPFGIMGAKAKFMMEVIPMISAATLRQLLGFNYVHIELLLSCTAYFYIYAHFLHVAYDIGVIDLLLGVGMQFVVYLLDAELLVRALALSFCFVLCLYRYITYCAPEMPDRPKKELEQLPC